MKTVFPKTRQRIYESFVSLINGYEGYCRGIRGEADGSAGKFLQKGWEADAMAISHWNFEISKPNEKVSMNCELIKPRNTQSTRKGEFNYGFDFPRPPVRLRAQGISEVEVLTRSTAWLR